MTSEFYRNKRALITGGLGFIGSNLALRLVELGADVTLVDSMLPAYGATVSNIEPIRDRVHVNFSDVRDPHSMRHLIRERDLIFSLAGQVSHSESMRDPMTDLEINCRSAPSTSPWTRTTPWSRWT
jgi:nucleoside-diphosphate-sugar epimerase